MSQPYIAPFYVDLVSAFARRAAAAHSAEYRPTDNSLYSHVILPLDPGSPGIKRAVQVSIYRE